MAGSRMAASTTRKKSTVAANVGEASEDGDFVALRARREANEASAAEEEENLVVYIEYLMTDLSDLGKRSTVRRHIKPPEELSELTRSLLAEIKEQHPDVAAPPRPFSARHRKRPPSAGGAAWDKLTEAANTSPTAFREVLSSVSQRPGLTSQSALNPRDNQNILHFALELGDKAILDIVLEQTDEALVKQQFDIQIMKINGKKNALHQAVEMNRLDILRQLLAKLPKMDARKALLLQETPMKIEGQRPRTFPCVHLAAFFGHTELVVYLLEEQSLDVNHLNAKKDSALLWAARWGHQDTVRTLLKKGALPDLENDKGSTALYWAVRYNYTETVELLAKEGHANVNQTRKLGFVAPIVLASALGMEPIVQILLEYGADPNMEIRGGERPIHHAGREGYPDILEVLIARGAEVDAVDERGDTALLLAAKYSRAKAMQTLLQQGASVTHKNHMLEDVWSFAVESDSDLILQLLVIHQRKQYAEDGGPMAPTSSGANSLLFLAASVGNCDRIALLIKMNMETSATDDEGNNFLHHAAINNQAQVIERFHKQVSIDMRNSLGNTPLHEACSRGNHEVILELIKAKAMSNIRNYKGETALHVAASSKAIQPGTIAKLMEYVIRTHPWECLNIKDDEGNNPLHIAAKCARPEVLWEFRFVRFKDPDVDGNIALHESVRAYEPECLETMLDIYDAMKRDCDINHTNNNMETTLFLAAKHGFQEGMKRLLLFGADISIANHMGNTVLHLLTSLTVTKSASSGRYLELMDLILEKAHVWYCSKYNQKLTETNKEELLYVKRRAILKLTCETYNQENLSVLSLACKIGAADVVNKLFSMENVLCFSAGRTIRYDVTNLTPKTNGTLAGMGTVNSVSPRPSCLEWLLATGDKSPGSAATVLDNEPFRNIENSYGHVSAWAYAILMVVHIVYMALHSWSGIFLLDKSRTSPGVRDADAATLLLYIVIPLEPAFIVLYNIYRVVKLSCMGEIVVRSSLSLGSGWKGVMYVVLTLVVSLVHALFVILWIIMYGLDVSKMDYILAVSLCIGWLYTISFTRGFKLINYFWRLIQIMVVKDVFKFMVIYLFVLMAFSFAFHALFQVSTFAVGEYNSPLDTLFLMFNMMIGMDYVFEGTLEAEFNNIGREAVTLKVFYIVYMILATIVLLNLLIAMMNDSYQAILQKQRLAWRIESVKLGVDVEKSIPLTFDLFSKIRMTEGFICLTDQEHGIKRWFVEVHHHSRPSELEGLDDDIDVEALEDLKAKVSTIEAKVTELTHQLKTGLEDIQSALRTVESGHQGR